MTEFVHLVILDASIGVALATLVVLAIRIGYVLNVRVREAQLQAVRVADNVAEVVAAIQASDDARLMRARVALENIVAPYYHAGLPPYRQSAALDDDAVRQHHVHVLDCPICRVAGK